MSKYVSFCPVIFDSIRISSKDRATPTDKTYFVEGDVISDGPKLPAARITHGMVKYSSKDFLFVGGKQILHSTVMSGLCRYTKIFICFLPSGHNGVDGTKETYHYDGHAARWTKKQDLPVPIGAFYIYLVVLPKESGRYILAGWGGNPEHIFK